MKAGRELDALVAEEVMEVCACTYYNRADHLSREWETTVPDSWAGAEEGRTTTSSVYHADDGERRCTEHDRPAYGFQRYSTDISAAWEVVEKMYQGHWAIEYDPITLDWHVTMGPHDVVADTAPLAICLAALKAVGAEIPEDT